MPVVSLSTPVSSIHKTDRHDITEILLKVAFNSKIGKLNLNQFNLNIKHRRDEKQQIYLQTFKHIQLMTHVYIRSREINVSVMIIS
jgi:hypothetical protein